MEFNLIEKLPIIVTIFFFIAFCAILFSVFKKGTKRKMSNYAKIPLRDGETRRGNGRNIRRSQHNKFGRHNRNYFNSGKSHRGNNRGYKDSRREGDSRPYKGNRFIGNSSLNNNQSRTKEKSEN